MRTTSRAGSPWLQRGTNSTFFDSIFILPPGHSLLFEKGLVELNAVWEPRKLPLLHLKDPREYADGLRTAETAQNSLPCEVAGQYRRVNGC